MVHVYKLRAKITKLCSVVRECRAVLDHLVKYKQGEGDKNSTGIMGYGLCSNQRGDCGDGASQVEGTTRDQVSTGSARVCLCSNWAS